jgi:Peptidoglycan-binding protein, CsiV
VRPLGPALLLSFCLTASSAPACAQSYYDVEIVVFESLSAPTILPEPGTEEPAFTPPPAGLAPDERFEPLPPDRLLLQPEYQRLRNSKQYRPLLHLAWRQQVLGPRQSVARPIFEQVDDARIDGELRVYVESYLHVDMDLGLALPGEGRYRLRESRRVRSKETHYFDNARFGVLLRLTPS